MSWTDAFASRALLTYSAVCGIGLDTVPIAGDTPAEKIAAIMRDTGTMAFRLNKPLTVRFFPVPGLVTAPLLYPFFKREIARLWTRFKNAPVAPQTEPLPEPHHL